MVGCAELNPEIDAVPELLPVLYVQEKQDLLESNKELLQVKCGALTPIRMSRNKAIPGKYRHYKHQPYNHHHTRPFQSEYLSHWLGSKPGERIN